MDEFNYKPAGDHGLTPAEGLRSLKREAGLFGNVTQAMWRTLVRTYFRAYHRLEISGTEHIPDDAPFILIANHASHLDALALSTVLPWRLRRKAFPIAAGDVFFETPTVSAFSAFMLNALPMWRKKCGMHALQVLRERLIGEPAIYILFPEGTRSRDGSLGEFKPGIGMMVAGTPARIVPAYLSGAWNAWRPKTRLPKPLKLRIRIGRPRQYADLSNERASWETIATELRADVEALGRELTGRR